MKPIVTFDLETTGLDKEKDFIIQFAAVKFNPETYEILDSKMLYIKPEGSYSISIQAYLKHHISPEFLVDKPYFFEVADEIIEFFEGCDVLTYNGIGFDMQFLNQELKHVGKKIDFLSCKVYDSFLEEKRRNGISLGNTYKRYTGQTMEEAGFEAHDALSDVKATIEIFKHQNIEKPYDGENMICEDNFIVNSNFQGKEVPCFAIGKYKELPISYIANIDKDYLNWCIGPKANFSDSTKNFIKQYMK